MLAVDLTCRLYTEDRLHVTSRGSGIRARQHKHCRPFLYRDTGGELAAGQRNGIVIFLDGLAHQFQSIVIVAFLKFIALSCHICNAKMAKHGVLTQHFGKCLGFFHARHHPQCVLEHIAVLFCRVRIQAIRIWLGNQIQKAEHVLCMAKIARLLPCGDGGLVHFGITRPSPKKLAEIEGLALQFVLYVAGDLISQLVCIYVHARQIGVRIMVTGMQDIPLCLALLLHHVVPRINSIFIILV